MAEVPHRTALIVGGASGIGAATAHRLAAEGGSVIVADRDVDRVRTVAGSIGARWLALDVTDEASVRVALDQVEQLDVLVNSAGIATETTVDDEDLDVFRHTLDVNLEGMLRVTRAAVPLLRDAVRPRVVNVGSVQGSHAAPRSLAYAASKAAVHTLTQGLAVDLADDGILVNAVAPGFVETPMAVLPDGTNEHETERFRTVYVDNARIPLRRPAGPEEIAVVIGFLASAENTYMTGAVVVVDGGLTATF